MIELDKRVGLHSGDFQQTLQLVNPCPSALFMSYVASAPTAYDLACSSEPHPTTAVLTFTDQKLSTSQITNVNLSQGRSENSDSSSNCNAPDTGLPPSDDQSDSDEITMEFDGSSTNPYVEIINSTTPHEKPSNWHSYVLFNGRFNSSEFPLDCLRPQRDDGSILPEVRPLIQNLINSDGTLRDRNGPALTMQAPGGSQKTTETIETEARGYLSANGRSWFRKKPNNKGSTPDSSIPVASTTTTTTITRKRYANQSLVIANGRRIYTFNSNECIPFAQSGKCRANNLCAFDHNGNSDHRNLKLCRDQMLGFCRNDDASCFKGLHGLSEHQLPVCHYFLKMCCAEESCTYLHIKHQDTLENCALFQKGICLSGLQCTKPHKYNLWTINTKCDQDLSATTIVERNVKNIDGLKNVGNGDETQSTNQETSIQQQQQQLPTWNF